MAWPSRRAGYTVAMVERAIRLYDARGREAALEYYNSPESGDDEWYVFIFDENEKLIALAVNPAMLGEDMRGDVGGFHRLPARRSDSRRHRGRGMGRPIPPQSCHRHSGGEIFLGGTARWSDFRLRLVPESAGMDAGVTRRIGVGLVAISFQPLRQNMTEVSKT
ncbi:MAG: hypothetical protein OXF86_16065 [Caldilineaceae bacterium]|nr:hypothetical protein [Caldilineaceae bacterium]